MFMVVNDHHGGSLSTIFLIFQEFRFWGVWRPFSGQNLPQIRNIHNDGQDIRLVWSRIDLMLQMK